MQKDHLEIILEEMNSKFQLVLEGHAVLNSNIESVRSELIERIDHLDFKIDTVNNHLSKRIDEVDEKLSKRIDEVDEKLSKRIDEVDEKLSNRINEVESSLTKHIKAVATDLSAHRADTEAHGPIYRVKESW